MIDNLQEAIRTLRDDGWVVGIQWDEQWLLFDGAVSWTHLDAKDIMEVAEGSIMARAWTAREME